jgi:23S rRNA (pseudouridine1915-N3)-methyltransferase
MHITLFTIGKLKDTFFGDAQVHYEKMLRPFCHLTIEELHDDPIRKSEPKERIIQREGERILKWISPDDPLIVLDERGEQFSSLSFAQWMGRYKDQGASLQFVIGGPYGVSPHVKQRAIKIISLSPLTLPHQLARIVFLEQLYRAWTILQGKQYHY